MAGEPTYYSSGAYASSGTGAIVGPTVLYWCYGFNPTPTGIFVQLHNTLAPGVGRVPEVSIKVDGGQSWSWCPSIQGRRFSAGCSWIASASGDVLAISGIGIWLQLEARSLQ